ncbi:MULTISPECIES: putative Ig domain-containing protein [unclassified Sphingomonas]|uniref:putative Ig domain-containing protein n=1 Tax=unclassified Sphingomonas TaxID=196159 RepID=UPI0018E57D2C|nr:putative Ig domain-containing protein [Sphingomonas sp. FARSPH]
MIGDARRPARSWRRHVVAAAAGLAAMCGGLMPARAFASTGCDQINAGALNRQVTYTNGSISAANTKLNGATTAATILRTTQTSDQVFGTGAYYPDATTTFAFAANDQITLSSSISGFSTGTNATSSLRVGLRRGVSATTGSNVGYIVTYTSNATQPNVDLTISNETALGVQFTMGGSTASGTITTTVTCTPAASAPTLGSFTYGSTVAYNAGSATATNIDVATGGNATNTPTGYTVSDSAGGTYGASAATAGGGTVTIASNGAAAYTPRVGYRGNDTFYARASNGGGTSNPASVTVSVGNPTLTATLTGSGARQGAALSGYAVTPAGGASPYTCALNSGSAAPPAGVTLATNCTLSGTPTVSGTFSFAVDVTDSSVTGANGSTASPWTQNNVAIGGFVIAAPLPTIAAIAPAVGPTGQGTSVTITGTNFTGATAVTFGGVGASTFTVTSATQITATTPATVTAGAVDVVVTTPGGVATSTNGFRFSAAPAAPVVTAPANGATTGATRPTYTGTAGANLTVTVLVDGASIGTTTASAAGNWTTTQPTALAATSHTVAAQATNADGLTGPVSASNTFTVTPAPLASAYTAPAVAYNPGGGSATSFSIAAKASGSPTGFAVGSAATAQGGAVSITNAGLVSYTAPVGFRGNDSFTYTASNAGGTSAPAVVTVPVSNPALSATLSGSGTRGVALGGVAIAGAGGLAPYSCATTLVSGALPAGTTLASDCTIIGTPTASGSFSFTVGLTDSSQPAFTQTSGTLTLVIAAPTLTLTPSTLPGATAGVAYSQALSAGGGVAPYSYAVTTGALPSGITLAGGTLSGTPTQAGIYNVTITATDSATAGSGGPYTAARSYALTVAAPTIALTQATIPAGTAGVAYSQTLTASGGTPGYTYAVTSGALPAGVTLATGGTLSGTPTAAGTFNVTITATDSSTGSGAPYSGSRAYTLTIAAPTIALTPTTIPAGTAGTAYSQTLTASGGTPAYTYAVTAGALPAGVTLSTSGTLSGTPIGSGTFNFTVTATDSTTGTGAPYTGSRSYALTITAPTVTLTPAMISAGTAGVAYSETLTASGGTPTYTYAVTAGALPAGLTLSTGGTLSGTPTAAGTFNVTITATDSSTGSSAPYSGSRAYTLTIAAPTITLTPTTIPAGTAGAAYSQTLSASGGTPTYTYAVTAGALPAGLTLATGGTLSGTPVGSDRYNFTVTATDSTTGSGAPYTGSRSYALTIAAPTIALTQTTIPAGTAGVAYSETLNATGGTPGYTYAVTAGALPAGVTLSTGGTLSGTPTAAGTFNVTITATDSSTGSGAPYTGSRNYTLTIAAPTIALTPTTISAGTAGTAYSQTLTASGGTPAYTYAVTAGALPAGVTLATSGTLSGTPVGSGTFNFTITATDSTTGAGAPYTGSRSYALTIAAPTVTLTPTSVPAGTAGVAYSETLTATGGTPGYTYAVTAGALPAGVTLATGGTLSGTPTAAGTFNVTITATDSSTGSGAPYTGSRAYTLTIAAPTIALTPTTIPAGTAGTAYSQTLTASGGTPAYTYAVIAGALPAGLTLSTSGTLSGTPVGSGTYNFTLTATDATTGTGAPYTGSRSYALTIAAPTIALTPTSVPAGTAGVAYSETLTASGGTPGYTYAVTAGALPAGLTLSTSGTLSGTPTAAGTFNVTITATDSSTGTGAPYTGSRAYTLTVAAPTIALTPTTIPAGTAGVAYSQTLTASGGTPAYTYTVTAGALPAGVTLSSSGALSGTPVGSGTYTFTVTATDSTTGAGAPYAGSQSYTLSIAAPTIAVSPASTPGATVGVAYRISLSATGGTAPYAFVVTAGALPAGLTLAADGTLGGTPTAGGSFSFAVTATDASTGRFTGTRSYMLTVGAPTIALAPASLPAGTVGAGYNSSITASGGTPIYTYAVTAGALPAGLTLTSDGTLSGTPTAAGSFTATITATDASTGGTRYTGSQAYTLSIAAAALSLQPATLPAATARAAYAASVSATGGTAPYSYRVSAGSLPAGVTLATDGTLSGTPSAPGNFTVTIAATDSSTGAGAPFTATRSYTLAVAAPPLSIATTTLPAMTVGRAYSATIAASGGIAPYGYAVTAGTLPTGISLASDGTLSGVPTAGGSFAVTITVTDGATQSAAQAYTIAVAGAAIAIAPTTLPSATPGLAYSQTLAATGGTAPYTYAITTGSLPAGLTLASNGTLAGTPTAGGSFTFAVTATDGSTGSGPYTGTQSYTLAVGTPTIVVTGTGLPGGTVGAAYGATLGASGGVGPYRYAVSSGALPAGLTLVSDGTLAGTPTASGNFPITITATDSSTGAGPFSGSRALVIAIAAPTIALTPATLPAATPGTAYSQTLTAAGGIAPYGYAITAGALPPGVTLSTSGTLAGTPTAGGSFAFTVTATDSAGGNGPHGGSQAYTLTVGAPTVALAPTSLPAATAGTAYSQTLGATGGTAPYGYAVTAGALPAGVTLAANGTLSGTPTATGSFGFTVTATDSSTGAGPYAGTRAYTLLVNAAPIALGTAALPAGTVGTAYAGAVAATGGVAPYRYAVSADALPTGVTLASDGTLSGTPTASGTFTATVTVTDSATGTAATASRAYTIAIAAPALTLSPATLPTATSGAAYSQTLAAGGGTAPYTYAVSAGSLPAGLTLSSTGTLAGTPTAGGSFTFTLTATDSSTGAGPYSVSRAYTLAIAAPTVVVDTTALPGATVGTAYAATLAASGGVGPYRYAVSAGALPAGVTLASDGTLSGTPTTGGSFAVTVTATDSSGGSGPFSGSRALTLTVAAPTLALTPANLPAGTVGTSYAATLAATGGTPGYTYAVSAGALPTGVTLDAKTGALSGTPTASGSFAVTITATDSSTGAGPYSATRAYTIAVAAPTIAITPASLPAANVGTAYAQTVSATGGTPGYRFAVSAGALPAGITLAANGTLSGTPTAGGRFAFTLTATDSSTGSGGAFSASQAYVLAVDAPTLALAQATLPGGNVGSAYSASVAATGGVAPYRYAVSAGALPAGVTLDAATGTLAGTPTAGGSFAFTLTATDSSTGAGPYSVSRAYTLAVAAPTLALAQATLPGGNVGSAYSASVAATGGVAPYRYAVSAGALPAGVTLDAATGTLAGTPTAGGSFTFTLTATDSSTGAGPYSVSRAYTLAIGAPTVVVDTATLPGATVGNAYTATLSASGGVGPYRYAVTTGALPAGVTLATDGTLSGTPTKGGSFAITVTATDSSGGSGPFSGSRALTLVVAAPTLALTPATLPAGTVGASYAATLAATGGTPGYTYAVSAGALPTGVTLDAKTGALSGTPTASGSFAVTITATDSSTGAGPYSATRTYTIAIAAPTLTLAQATVPGGTVGTAYSASLAASGGVAPYRYSVSTGALPAGVTLDAAAGALAGTPTAGGDFTFTLTATDSSTGAGPYSVSRAYTLAIGAATVAITTATLPDATVAAAYSQTLAANGGIAPYSYAVTAGSLPAGLALSPTGTIAGTPTASGSFTVTIAARDASTGAGPYAGTRTLTLAVRAAAVSIDTAALPDATVAAAYSQALAASGGVAPYSYAVSAGTLPAGLTLSPTGTLSGTPTAGGRFTVTVTATDSSAGAGPASATRVYTLNVAAPAIALTPATLPAATTGAAYSQTLGAAGGIAPYSYAITAGALPTGLTLSSTGTLSGTPTVGGSFAFTVTASDTATGSGPYRGTQAYTLVVGAAAIVVDPAPLATATVGQRYAATLSASGGIAPYRYAVSAGALPAGVTLAGDGTLSGIPTAGGSFAVTISATDSSGGSGPFSATRALTLTVTAPTLALTPTALADGRVQQAYGASLSASGGTAPYSFAVTAGALPTGVTLAANGTLAGTPSVFGTFAFTVTATDASTGSGPYTAAQAYRLVIAAPDAPVAGATSLSVAYGAGPTIVRPVLTGGTATALAIATPPQHGTATVDGLTLRYAPAAGYFGADSFAYTASNDGGTSAPATVSVTVAKPAAPTAADRDGIAVAYASAGTSIDLATSITGVVSGVTITTPPAHGSASVSGTIVTYVPANGYFGADSFGYAATGPGGTSAPASVRLTVAAPPPPAAKPGAGSVAGSTQGGTQVGIDLGALVDGVTTGVEIVVQPQHGTVTLSAAPAGNAVALGGRDAATGVISTAATGGRYTATYTPAAGFAGVDSFQFVAVGPGGRSAAATVTITVLGTAPIAQNKVASIGDGQQVSIDLTAGAVGGPFTAAQVVSASPAGVAQTAIVATGAGYRLDVTPANRFGGTLAIRYTLTNAFGTSTPATVTVTVAARPDPSLDPTLRGLSDAQAESARRLTRAQIDNFMRRAETLHGGGGRAGVSMGTRLNALGIGGTGVASGQSFGERMLHPGATSPRDDLDRRSELAAALDGAAPGARTIGRHAAGAPAATDTAADPADATDGTKGGRRIGAPGIWSGGSVDVGTLDAREGRSKITASTAGLSAGVDVRVAPGVTLGVGGGYGNEASRIGGDAARLRTHGTMAAAYASVTPVDGTFIDGMIGRGDLDMRLRRLVAQTGGVAVGDRKADLVFGALAAGIDRSARTLRWSAYGRFEYMQADLAAYRETGADRYNLRFDARRLRSLGGVLGGRIEGLYRTTFGAMMPRLRAEWRHEFADADPQLLDYADIAGPAYYRLDTLGWRRDQFQLSIGTRAALPDDWLLDLDLGVSAGQGQRSGTVRVGIGKGF